MHDSIASFSHIFASILSLVASRSLNFVILSLSHICACIWPIILSYSMLLIFFKSTIEKWLIYSITFSSALLHILAPLPDVSISTWSPIQSMAMASIINSKSIVYHSIRVCVIGVVLPWKCYFTLLLNKIVYSLYFLSSLLYFQKHSYQLSWKIVLFSYSISIFIVKSKIAIWIWILLLLLTNRIIRMLSVSFKCIPITKNATSETLWIPIFSITIINNIISLNHNAITMSKPAKPFPYINLTRCIYIKITKF